MVCTSRRLWNNEVIAFMDYCQVQYNHAHHTRTYAIGSTAVPFTYGNLEAQEITSLLSDTLESHRLQASCRHFNAHIPLTRLVQTPALFACCSTPLHGTPLFVYAQFVQANVACPCPLETPRHYTSTQPFTVRSKVSSSIHSHPTEDHPQYA